MNELSLQAASQTAPGLDADAEKHSEHLEDSSKALQPDEEEEPDLPLKTWIVFLALGLQQFSINFAVSGSGFWLGYIVPAIGGGQIAAWVPNSGLTVQVGLTAIFGLVADFGPVTRKWLASCLPIIGAVGLAIGGAANSMDQLIAGAAISGFSFLSFLVQPSIAADIFPRRMRGIAQGALYGMQSLGGVTSYLAGGRFIETNAGGKGGWRWIFYFPAIMQVCASLLVCFLYRPVRQTNASNEPSFFQRLKTIDWIGATLFSGSMVPILIGLTWGGNTYPWSSASVVAPLVVGCACLVVFVLHQWKYTSVGVANHRLFKHRNFAIAIISIFVEGLVYITLNVFLGQQIGTLFGPRPVLLGLHFALVSLFSGISSTFWGFYSKATREVKRPLLGGFALFIVAVIGFSQVKPNATGERLAWAMPVVLGIALGAPLSLILTVGQLAVEPDLIALATAHVIGIRSFGALIGVAIASAISAPKLAKLPGQTAADYAASAGVAASSIPDVVMAVLAPVTNAPIPPGLTADQLAAAARGAKYGYAEAYSYVYYFIIPFAALALLSLCFLKPVKEQMTWHIDQPLAPVHAKHKRKQEA